MNNIFMSPHTAKTVIIRGVLLFVFLSILGTIIAYARGYRLNITEKKVVPTGILVASSTPESAKIYIDGKLYGVTNSNITLPPGHYHVQIKKDGYSTWENNLTIKGELVVKTDALLFPLNPSLAPLTSLGIVKAHFFEGENKIVVLTENQLTATPSASGVYLLDNGRKQLSIFNPLRTLVLKSAFPTIFDFADTSLEISPDGEESIMIVSSPVRAYLFSLDEDKQQPIDITRSVQTVRQAWATTRGKNLQRILESFKDPLPQIASDSFDIISFSPDESKILYRAKQNTLIPTIVKPPLISTNQTQQTRDIRTGSLYVYDKIEDTNYLLESLVELNAPTIARRQTNIPSPSPTIGLQLPATNYLWYPDSKHLVIREDNQISVIDYDGTHKQVVYSGPFEKDFLAVTQEGKLLILANLNPQKNNLPDVYAVGIR